MVETGTVVTDGDTVIVAVARSEKCDRCHACKIYRDERFMSVQAENSVGACKGDYVKVRTRHNGYMCLFILNWLLPLIGAAVGYAFSTLVSAVAAKVALIVCLFLTGMAAAICIEAFCLKKIRGAKPRVIELCDAKGALKPQFEDTDREDKPLIV